MGTELVPNISLRKAIAEWREQQPVTPLTLDPEALSLSDVLGVGSFGTVLAGTLKTHGREQRVAAKTLNVTLCRSSHEFRGGVARARRRAARRRRCVPAPRDV
jgi:hypothetical protein